MARRRDPLAEKTQAKAEAAIRKTFDAVAAMLIDARRAGWKTSFQGRTSTLTQWRKDMAVDCKPIAGRGVAEIGVADIKAIVEPYWRRRNLPRAKQLLGRIEMVFDYAIAHGWRKADNPASWRTLQHIAPHAPSGAPPHHAAIPWTDVPETVRRLRAKESVSARILEFIILTAIRSGEARGARWSEIDWDRRTWTIPVERMKKNREHAVPLSEAAIALLRRMEVEGESANDGYIFPGGRGETQSAAIPMSNQSLWLFVQRLVGGEVEATVHGFRSAFKVWADNNRIDRDLSERCLAHVVGDATEQAYGRDELVEPRRPVMEAWARFVAADNVVPFSASPARPLVA